MSQKIFTIGFGKKSLRQFVKLLKDANVTILVDVRLNNTSQLSGFAKKDDLAYILELIGIGYIHDLSLAPDADLLEDYKKKRIVWEEYSQRYLSLLEKRDLGQMVERILGQEIPCFLCSEDRPQNCHRSLLANYLRDHSTENIEIKHLY